MIRDMSNAPAGATAGASDGTPRLMGGDLVEELEAFISGQAESHPEEYECWEVWAMRLANASLARIRELEAEREWKPIETAPKDGTEVLVWAQLNPPEKWHESVQDLPPFVGIAAYHPDAGWCVCTMREVTHWQCRPKPPPAVQVAEGSRAAASHTSPPRRRTMADQKPTYDELVVAIRDAEDLLKDYIEQLEKRPMTSLNYGHSVRKRLTALLTRIRQGGESNG